MAVTTVQDAKDLIGTTNINTRAAGLRDLIHILKHNRGKSTLESIGNKAYLALCDTLFKCMRDERTAFFKSKAKNNNKKASPAGVLTLSAAALRQIINSGVRTIKSSTVEIIIDSIIELLPGKDGTLLEPLLEDLSKSLRALLEYSPHVERLSEQCWASVADFCIDSLSGFMLDADTGEHESWSTGVSSRGRTPLESTDFTGRTSSHNHSGRKQIPENLAHTADDYIHCLQLLVTAVNAPVLEKADAILAILLQFLQRKTTRGHPAALSAVNAILSRISFQDVQLTERTIQDLIPLFRTLWADAPLREEILISLIHTEPHLTSLIADKHMEQTATDLEELVEVMYNEYRRRQESTVLQFLEDDHLCFRHVGKARADTHPQRTVAFSLETEHVRCESLWATVSAIARFSYMIDTRKRTMSQCREDGEDAIIKRLRITHHFQEYLRHVSEPRSNAKRAALQVIAFMVQEGRLDEEELQSAIEKLTACISNENPVHSSWAMIGLATAAFQQTARADMLVPYWVSVWQSASRACSSMSTSRAACHLMDVLLRLKVVPFAAISDTAISMLLSIELSGPALLTDASSSMLTTLIGMRIAENPTNYLQTAERILNWLITKWTPSFWAERSYSSLNAQHCVARDVLKLLHAILDRPYLPLDASAFIVMGGVAQARTQSTCDQDLGRYLFLLDEGAGFLSLDDAWSYVPESATTEHRYTPLQARMLDFCIGEYEKVQQRWKEWTQHNPQGITPDMLRIVTTFCIVASSVSEHGDPNDHRVLNLGTMVDQLTLSFASYLSRRETEQYKMDAVLATCCKSLPNISLQPIFSQAVFREEGIFPLAKHLPKALNDREEVKQSFHVEDDDFMDVDEGANSQPGGGAINPDHDVPRQEFSAQAELPTLRSMCSAYFHLIVTLPHKVDAVSNYIPSDFVEYFTSIHESEILRSRRFLADLLSAGLRLQRSSCLKLLEKLGEDLIDPRAREYNTSEVANILVVDVLRSSTQDLHPNASDEEGQELYENFSALYDYYVQEMETNGVRRSIGLQTAIAGLLDALLQGKRELEPSHRSRSPRTCFFNLLEHAEIRVKHFIVHRLPGICDGFVLAEHENIWKDIEASLAGFADRSEDTAIRLLGLSKLASRWHTLLRQGMYTIVKIVGSDSEAASHAKRCMHEIAIAKGLEDSRALLRLLAPQLLHDWLGHERRDKDLYFSFPFTIFDYPNSLNLLQDIESEAVAQAAMRGLTSELEYLSTLFRMPVSKILTRSFGKAAAYTFIWDIRTSGQDKSKPKSAQLLHDAVRSDQYTNLLQERFPQIVGYILQCIREEDKLQTRLEKQPAYATTLKALTRMISMNHSDQNHEFSTEPSFKAFNLLDAVERLCRRSGENPLDFWGQSTFSIVLRMLLDRLHPALGSLHARSIIRKIRILVACAGNVAFQGYPLTMTLQSLRPFLSDIQTADDTLGIMQYLFDNGQEYLRQDHLKFVTGIGLSTLITIRVFLGSSQESTTQQSQHVATMTKTQRFHNWLTRHLHSYASAFPESEQKLSPSIKAFRAIISAASNVRTEGTSARGSEEGNLLLYILDDARSGRKLLNNTSREVALDLLCQNFQPASAAHDDILGSDEEAAGFAPQVWDSCQRNGIGEGYLLWAGRVLGRAFGANGAVRKTTDQTLPWAKRSSSSKESPGRNSREAIVQKVVELFSSDDRNEVSLAETAVRLLASRLSSDMDSYVAEMNNVVPQVIGEGLKDDVRPFPMPTEPEAELFQQAEDLQKSALPPDRKPVSHWVKDLVLSLCATVSDDPVLRSLDSLITGIERMPELLFPYVLHLALLAEYEGRRSVRETLSEALEAWFAECDSSTAPYVRILLQAILYLRTQPTPKEVTRVDRDRWLEIDYLQASRAATTCSMYRTALLFAETSSGQPILKSSSRRSSVFVDPPKLPVDLQLSIYRNLDEPDSFYGVERGSNLSAVLDRLEYESDGMKSLLFRGARLDSQMRRSNMMETTDTRGMVKSLITLNMNSVTHSLMSNDRFRDIGDDAVDSTLHTARKLGQWDIKAPEGNHSEASTLFKAFQSLHYATDATSAQKRLDRQVAATMALLTGSERSATTTHSRLRTLAALAEANELVNVSDPTQLLSIREQMKSRERWMRAGEFDDVRLLISCRETLLSVLSSNTALQDAMRVRTPSIRSMEVEALVSSSTICRRHGALQEALASVTYLSDIAHDCKAVGLDIDAIAQHEIASVLWDQGEIETSIRMRENLIDHATFDSQVTDISLPVLLAKLGHHRAEARLANPDTIIQENLEPAIRELQGQTQGLGLGQVFHEFALFCDKQLSSPEAAEDLARIRTVMDKKIQEHKQFDEMSKTDRSSRNRALYERSAKRAMTWLELDKTEYDRLRKGREQLLQQCLENYLLSLHASDEYNNDALRVFALWLEYSETTLANNAVAKYLRKVPSGKFALLMNQLSSRLLSENSEFQKLLAELVHDICVEHPYHGMHHLFAILQQQQVSKMQHEDLARSRDDSTKSRYRATFAIAEILGKDKRAAAYWKQIYVSDKLYHELAMYKHEADNRTGREISLDKYSESRNIVQKIPALKVPPATLQIEVRANCDYSDLPKITAFKPKMSIANGLSAPKVITAIGSDGKSYKQLFKSGNDDLRQDAIMEQVFDQVSRLLKNHTATRLRNLGIRTYKVLPLSTRSGLMEFVQNTIPLHQWVMPAHKKYYPSDWDSDRCRKEITTAANTQTPHETASVKMRLKVWQKCAANFHPVLRYFLLERFQDPDEWFEKRTAYTRSTAAISILGHVLGLGDRHCHNILLDEKSGEVVHIDLGVSFEAGRVLPIPEVVPFRLTRDLVDAMGYTKTEGVFQRCCEFMLETLREEKEAIMTLLNVLRYDPLVNWSVTPTKAKRMQENQETGATTAGGHSTRAGTAVPGTPMASGVPQTSALGVSGVGAGGIGTGLLNADQESHKKREEQAGEAGRALAVVEKKLSKTLSTRATVNELVQQATDEQNLAVLYSGWASYA